MPELANGQRLSDRERKLREILQVCRQHLVALGAWVAICPRYTPLTMACPYGQGAANYVRQRSGYYGQCLVKSASDERMIYVKAVSRGIILWLNNSGYVRMR